MKLILTLKQDFYTQFLKNKWLNNANPWILSTSRCNHNLKFITTSSKDNKSLNYYITKIFIYISHMYSLLKLQYKKKVIN